MGADIFVSYSRQDGADTAGRIRATLIQRYGVTAEAIFLDAPNILPGKNFVEIIERALTSSRAMIVVISPSWLSKITQPEGDMLRLEVEAASRRRLSSRLIVVPVLAQGAKAPTPFNFPEYPMARFSQHASYSNSEF
jgi:hypothetical protein